MTIPDTSYLLPGSFYGAVQQIGDYRYISDWATKEQVKLTELFALFGWTLSY